MREEIIGNARLILGDARDVIPTLGAIGSYITDPPFGMAYKSNFRTIKYSEIANDDNDNLLVWACNLIATHSTYVFGRWDNLLAIPRPKSKIAWVKNNWSMGDLQHEHARQTEEIFFYPGPDHDFPKYRPTDVIEAPRTGNDNHPTEKPVQLMMAIVEWTRGLVCDPFMGSGSTGVACARLGRPFVGVELDPVHFETACRRIREVGKQADMFTQPAAPAPVTADLFS